MNAQSLCAENEARTGTDAGSAAGTHGDHGTPPAARQAKGSALRCVVYGPTATPNGFDQLADEWNSLLKRSRFNSIFLTHEWQTTWWRYQGEGALWIVAFRHPVNQELVGIAPFYWKTDSEGRFAGKRKLNIVGCIEVSDYLDAIIAKGWETQVYQALLTWLHSADAPPWDVVDLCNLPQASLTYQTLPAIAEESGYRVECFQEDVAPQFTLPLHYESYLEEQVEKKQRHEIRRKQRRAEREVNVGFYIVGQEHSLEGEVDDFIALQRASRADKSEFMTPAMRRFFTAAARVMFDAGYLRLLFLTLNDEKAAALFAFEYDRRFWLYNSGYDPDAHAQLSPGWVLLAYSIQYAIAAGCRVFDFMQGNEEYKYRFGAQDYRVMRVLIHNAQS
jgi:CelD/BcsL family acetyltransferase involved in cellulose biosynthesis